MSSPISPADYNEPLLRLLAVLFVKKNSGQMWLADTDLSRELRDFYGINIHWKTARAILQENDALVSRRKRDGKWEYAILKAGENSLTAADSGILFIDPAKAVKGTLSLHAFLAALKGIVRICDPYVDYATIEHLDACNPAVEIRLLTRNVKDTGDLRRLVAAARTQGRKLEIRIVGANVLHDRYVVDDSDMVILGTSLNGFGKKQCFVVNAGEDIRTTMLPVFDGHWGTATPWP